MHKLLPILCFFIIGNTQAQVATPPSLEVGLSKVLGSKGTIDLQVLAQLIAEKQGELKKEFIKRSVYNHLEGQSYVLWEYAYSSMDILLESNDGQSIKKNLLEQSTNLAVCYVFAEFYSQISLGLHKTLPKNKQGQVNNVLETLYQLSDKRDSGISLSKFVTEKEQSSIKLFVQGVEKTVNVSQLFLDMTFDILSQNKIAEELGFFQSNFPLGVGYYQQTSKYHQGLKSDKATQIQGIYNIMKRDLDFLMTNFLLIKHISRSELSLDSLIVVHTKAVDYLYEQLYNTQDDSLSQLPRVVPTDTKVKLISQNLFQQISTIYQDLNQLQLADSNWRKMPNEEQLSIQIVDNLLAFGRFQAGGSAHFEPYDLYWNESSVKPLLLELTTKYAFNPKYLSISDQFNSVISLKVLKQFKESLDSKEFKGLSSMPISEVLKSLNLLLRLDELDFAETYELVLQASNRVPEWMECESTDCARSFGFVKAITDNLKKYTTVNKDSNTVDIAVEDLILRLYEKFGNRQKKTVDLYFSIGVNQSISSNLTFSTLIPDSTGFPIDTVRSNLNSVAFAAEKIGVKIKILNVKRNHNLEIGERPDSKSKPGWWSKKTFRSKDPVVSDVYAVVYGSGLLYQLLDLRTSNNFDDPIMGLGLGVSFFNALDFNIGYNWPLKDDGGLFDKFSSEALWTISFDVRISEYLARLTKK